MTDNDVSNLPTGLHEQSHLFRPLLEAGPAHLCGFPLRRDLVHALRPLPPALRLFRAAPRLLPRYPAAGRRHGPQRHPPKPVARLLLHYLLPGRPNPPHPLRGPDELRPIPRHAAPQRHPHADSRLCGGGPCIVLRLAPLGEREREDDLGLGRVLCLLGNFCLFAVHGLDRKLPPQAADEQHAAPL